MFLFLRCLLLLLMWLHTCSEAREMNPAEATVRLREK